MSGDPLTGAGLLAAAAAAQAALDKGTPTAGSSEARFIALMIARALQMADRDLRLGPEIADQQSAVVGAFANRNYDKLRADIRHGRRDGHEALHHALSRLAALRLRATKPEALAPEDRG